MLQDKAGDLWFATQGGGVSKYNGKSFTNYTTQEGLANDAVDNILEDNKGIMWFSTLGGGVSRFDGKTFATYTTTEGLPDNEVYAGCDLQGPKPDFCDQSGDCGLTGYAEKGKEGQVTVPAQNDLTNEALKNYKPIFEYL